MIKLDLQFGDDLFCQQRAGPPLRVVIRRENTAVGRSRVIRLYTNRPLDTLRRFNTENPPSGVPKPALQQMGKSRELPK
jgi:hypothetical protein